MSAISKSGLSTDQQAAIRLALARPDVPSDYPNSAAGWSHRLDNLAQRFLTSSEITPADVREFTEARYASEVLLGAADHQKGVLTGGGAYADSPALAAADATTSDTAALNFRLMQLGRCLAQASVLKQVRNVGEALIALDAASKELIVERMPTEPLTAERVAETAEVLRQATGEAKAIGAAAAANRAAAEDKMAAAAANLFRQIVARGVKIDG